MPGKIAKVRDELTEVIDEIHQSQQVSGFFATSTMRMASAMRSFVDVVEDRFDAVDQRFDAVDQRFDAMDKRFDAMDERIKTVDTKVGLIADEVRKMSARQEDLFGRIGRAELEGRP